MRLNERRRSDLLEHLGVIVRSWQSLPESITGATASGNEPMLYLQATWLAEKLEEMLREHVTLDPNATPTDSMPRRTMRDRFRALLTFGKGRPDAE